MPPPDLPGPVQAPQPAMQVCGQTMGPLLASGRIYHCELPQGHPLPHREGETVWQPMESPERNSLVDHDTNHREPVADCEWCPRLPEPVTPPAQPVHTAPAGDVGHPGTPDGPAVLGRVRIDGDGRIYRAEPGQPGWWQTAFLVRPEVGRVLEAAQAWVARTHAPGASPPNLWADREDLALIAAVDALDQLRCDTCSGTGWIKQEGQIGVPGSGCTHGCPDCEVGRSRLARGELLEPDAYDDLATGGPDHDGLTGAPLEQAERDIEPDSCPVMVHRGGVHESEPCGRRRPCPYHAEPTPEPSPVEATDCPRHTTWRDCAVASCPPPQEPAPEPAGDGPGWDRASIESWLDFLEHGPEETRDPESADELRALLADRDRQEANWKSEAQRMLAVAEERDLAIAHDRQPYPTAHAYERTCAALEKHRAEAEQLRSELDEMTNARDEVRALLAEVTAERDRYREHSVTLNSVGWKLAQALGDVPDGAETVRGNPLEQADRLIAELERLRGDLGQEGERG